MPLASLLAPLVKLSHSSFFIKPNNAPPLNPYTDNVLLNEKANKDVTFSESVSAYSKIYNGSFGP